MAGRSHRSFSFPTKAFTLVELLVVVGIIAMLISILLPVLGKARESARRTACASNLHQCYVAIQMYAADNRDRLPPKFNFKSKIAVATEEAVGIYRNAPGYGVQTAPARYCGNSRNVFHCPADAGDATDSTSMWVRIGTSYSLKGADPTTMDVSKIKLRQLSFRDLGGDLFKPWDSDSIPAVQVKLAAGQYGPTKWHQKFYNMLLGDGRVIAILTNSDEKLLEQR